MSRENVERFRIGVEAVEHGDFETFIEEVDGEVVFEPLRTPISGSYAGHAGIRQFFADTAETFDIFRFDYSEIRDLGDRALAIGTLHIRVREGGVETDVPTAGIATFQDGRLIHWKDYGDRTSALEAVGLRE